VAVPVGAVATAAVSVEAEEVLEAEEAAGAGKYLSD